MESISVYGYDRRLLQSVQLSSEKQTSREEVASTVLFAEEEAQDTSSLSPRCYLLQLPLELREIILSLILPHTAHSPKGISWLRGTTAVLAACKQLHNEGTSLIYGTNAFVIDTIYDCSTFAYQWLLPSGLVPKRTMAFPEQLASRNVALMRRFQIRVHHVDSYTGMLKYNCGGHGLVEGLRDQVRFLCQALRELREIQMLHIELRDGGGIIGVDEIICAPFLELKNTRAVTISGKFSSSFAKELKTRLEDAYWKNSFLRLPPEVREQIYPYVFPDEDFLIKRTFGVHTPENLSLFSVSKTIHQEAISSFCRHGTFRLNLSNQYYYFGPQWRFCRWNLEGWAGSPPRQVPGNIGLQKLSSIRRLAISLPESSSSEKPGDKAVIEELFRSVAALLLKNPWIECLRFESSSIGNDAWVLDLLSELIDALEGAGNVGRIVKSASLQSIRR